jgi:hypothetical protein
MGLANFRSSTAVSYIIGAPRKLSYSQNIRSSTVCSHKQVDHALNALFLLCQDTEYHHLANSFPARSRHDFARCIGTGFLTSAFGHASQHMVIHRSCTSVQLRPVRGQSGIAQHLLRPHAPRPLLLPLPSPLLPCPSHWPLPPRGRQRMLGAQRKTCCRGPALLPCHPSAHGRAQQQGTVRSVLPCCHAPE